LDTICGGQTVAQSALFYEDIMKLEVVGLVMGLGFSLVMPTAMVAQDSVAQDSVGQIEGDIPAPRDDSMPEVFGPDETLVTVEKEAVSDEEPLVGIAISDGGVAEGGVVGEGVVYVCNGNECEPTSEPLMIYYSIGLEGAPSMAPEPELAPSMPPEPEATMGLGSPLAIAVNEGDRQKVGKTLTAAGSDCSRGALYRNGARVANPCAGN